MPDCLSPTRRTPRVAPPSTLERPPDYELPLQLALAWIFLRTTPINEYGTVVEVFSHTFVADILAIIATEAFEVNPSPATFGYLRNGVDVLIKKESARIGRVAEKRRERGMPVPDELATHADGTNWLDLFHEQFEDLTAGCGAIDMIEREIRNRIGDDDAVLLNVPEPLERLSPLGLFFRGLVVKLRKLGFSEAGSLSERVASWCEATSPPAAYEWQNGQGIEARDPNPSSEARGMTRISNMERHLEAIATGDYMAAHQTLLAFYDYRAALVGDDEKTAPHMLLNLVTFHYRTGGMEAAREVVEEAIRIARRVNDADALQQTLNLRQRIVTETEGAAWPAAELPNIKNQPVPLRRLMHAVSPMDDLWSLKAALDLGEPVPVAFRRIYTALGRTIPPEPVAIGESARLEPMNTAAWHAAQAGLWVMLGSEALASWHEDMALAAADLEREIALEVAVVRAERASLRGDFEGALALLLGDTAMGLDHASYRVWTRGVWGVLDRQATLARDTVALATLRGLRAPSDSSARYGPGGPVRDVWEPSARPSDDRGIVFAHGYVADALTRVREKLDADPPSPPHLMLRDVLAALELASGLGLWRLYRAGVVSLAEVLLAMDGSMAAKADGEVARVWDELVAGTDAEALVRAALARGKAHATIASEMDEVDAEHLERAVQFTDLAVTTARDLGAAALLDQASLLRDILTQFGAPPAEEVGLERDGLAETVRRVGEIVRLVGVRVSEGWK